MSPLKAAKIKRALVPCVIATIKEIFIGYMVYARAFRIVAPKEDICSIELSQFWVV